jgi:hypothetical protein
MTGSLTRPIADGAFAAPRHRVAIRHGWVSAARMQVIVALAIVPVGVSAIWLAAASEHVERPAATALYRCYLAVVPMLIGLYWWRRRPLSRFGPLLIGFGLVVWVVSWQSSDRALAFDLGVLAEGPLTFLTFYLFLAFPSGRLETTAERLLMGAWAVVLVAFFLPWALGSPVIASGGPLSTCVPGCPANVLQVGSAPRLVEFLGRWETYTGLVVTVATLAVYWVRLRAASRPRRRALVAVAVTSLLFLPIFFTYHFSRQILQLDPGTLETMSWFVVGARVLLPLGFLIALLQAELFAGVARGALLERLLTRPSPEPWRDDVAEALDDPLLRLGYWDVASGRYLADRIGPRRDALRYGCRPAARWIGLAAVAPASGVGGPGRSNRPVGPFEGRGPIAINGRRELGQDQPAAEPAESSASSASLSNSWRGTSPHSASRR